MVIARLRTLIDRRLLNTGAALYASQAATYLIPLMTVPFLARVLGPETWGLILFIQAIGLYVIMIVDFGFEYSATRQVARNQDDPQFLGSLFAAVLGAKLTLAAVCASILLVGQLAIPLLRDAGWLLWLGLFWALSMSLRPMWYFLGLQRMGKVLIADLSMRLIGVGMLFLLVRSPGDAWMVFAFQGAAGMLGVGVITLMAWKIARFPRPSVGAAIGVLRDGWRLFTFRLSTSVYNMSNGIILGLVAGAAPVAFYSGAERIVRVVLSPLYPLTQALYPRAALLATEDQASTAFLVRVTTAMTLTGAIGAAAVLYVLSPFAVRVLLGTGYEEAVGVLRILLLLLPLLAVSIPLTTQWMIPMGMDSSLNRITIGGGIVHIPLAILLGSQFAHTGVAWALVITEVGILIAIVSLLLLRRTSPFWRKQAGGELHA